MVMLMAKKTSDSASNREDEASIKLKRKTVKMLKALAERDNNKSMATYFDEQFGTQLADLYAEHLELERQELTADRGGVPARKK